MKDVQVVHVGDSLTNLSQKVDTVPLGEDEIFPNDPLKQFPSPNTVDKYLISLIHNSQIHYFIVIQVIKYKLSSYLCLKK